jgi:hypothetical protein
LIYWQAAPVLFTLETLIITVSAGAVAALVLGFVSGTSFNPSVSRISRA